MTKVTIHVAKTNLSKLIAKVEAGEEVTICRGDVPVAVLGPVAIRKPGALKGKIRISDAFYDPWSAKDFSPGIMDDDSEWGEPGTWDGRTPRKPGSLKGEITLDDSFFDPLSDEELGLANDDTAERTA